MCVMLFKTENIYLRCSTKQTLNSNQMILKVLNKRLDLNASTSQERVGTTRSIRGKIVTLSP